MKIVHKHTIKALTTNFELSCLFGLLITLGDFVWLCHDVMQNGISGTYIFVGSMLLIGLIGILYIIYRHNIALVRRLNKKLLTNKVKVVRKRAKHIDSSVEH